MADQRILLVEDSDHPEVTKMPRFPYSMRQGINRIEITMDENQYSHASREYQTMAYYLEYINKTCASCQNGAQFRCQGCDSTWYCSKKCVDRHWKKHKLECETMLHFYKKS